MRRNSDFQQFTHEYMLYCIANPPSNGGRVRLLKKLRRIFRVSEKQSLKHFVSGRVPDTKYFSGCKCTSCAPTAHKECAQQTAKNWRKRPQAFFDKLKAGPKSCFYQYMYWGFMYRKNAQHPDTHHVCQFR